MIWLLSLGTQTHIWATVPIPSNPRFVLLLQGIAGWSLHWSPGWKEEPWRGCRESYYQVHMRKVPYTQGLSCVWFIMGTCKLWTLGMGHRAPGSRVQSPVLFTALDAESQNDQEFYSLILFLFPVSVCLEQVLRFSAFTLSMVSAWLHSLISRCPFSDPSVLFLYSSLCPWSLCGFWDPQESDFSFLSFYFEVHSMTVVRVTSSPLLRNHS